MNINQFCTYGYNRQGEQLTLWIYLSESDTLLLAPALCDWFRFQSNKMLQAIL